jgi:putative acetyltransferase
MSSFPRLEGRSDCQVSRKVNGEKEMAELQPRIQIRRARAEDASAIAVLLYTAFAEYEASYTPEAFAATTPTEEGIGQRLHEGPVWVAWQEGQLVGTVGAVLTEQGVYVRGMAVAPWARGRQIGKRLLHQVEQFAHSQGAHQLYLSTTPFLEQAIGLYERCGFQRSEQGPQTLFGTPLFSMVKDMQNSPGLSEHAQGK